MSVAEPRDAAERLELQGTFCAQMGSAIYGSMFHDAALDYRNGGPVRRFFDANPWLVLASTVGLRVMGALHAFALEGRAPELAAHFPSCGGDGDATAAWRAARAVLERHSGEIAQRCREVPQTNEVARSMPLLGGALAVAALTGLPLHLTDVGSSAALNARLDRYAYEGPGWRWGDPSSSLVLRNRTISGRPAHLDAPLHVVRRRACDLHPLDIARDADRVRLRCYVWPDQLERFERLNRALEAASQAPLDVERADLLDWVLERAVPEPGAATVVMHSVVLDHLLRPERERFRTAIDGLASQASSDAPFAWLRMEFEEGGFATRLTLWPGARDLTIARSDGHAQDLVWSGSA